MTEFKKGDRVKVEFEGVVTSTGSRLMGLDVAGDYRIAGKSEATLLERPVEPLAPGSVVRSASGGVWVVVAEGVKYVGLYSSYLPITSPTTLAEFVRDYPETYTIIHDGSKK